LGRVISKTVGHLLGVVDSDTFFGGVVEVVVVCAEDASVVLAEDHAV
jgi:hypothetical protein